MQLATSTAVDKTITAIAIASDPNRMALAFKMAVEAGRAAYEMGLGESSDTAHATSPLTAFLE